MKKIIIAGFLCLVIVSCAFVDSVADNVSGNRLGLNVGIFGKSLFGGTGVFGP